jgi:hypothetical protein
VFIPTIALAAALLGRLAPRGVACRGIVWGLHPRPIYEFWVEDRADRISVLAFLLVGVLFGYLGNMVRQRLLRARDG